MDDARLLCSGLTSAEGIRLMLVDIEGTEIRLSTGTEIRLSTEIPKASEGEAQELARLLKALRQSPTRTAKRGRRGPKD